MARDRAFWKDFYGFSPWMWFARRVDRQYDNQGPSIGRLQKKESIGKSRGGNTTKIHVAVDAPGNPLKIKLTGGQVHDVTVAASVLADLKPDDAAYDSDNNKEQYKERHLVECFFQKLKPLYISLAFLSGYSDLFNTP